MIRTFIIASLCLMALSIITLSVSCGWACDEVEDVCGDEFDMMSQPAGKSILPKEYLEQLNKSTQPVCGSTQTIETDEFVWFYSEWNSITLPKAEYTFYRLEATTNTFECWGLSTWQKYKKVYYDVEWLEGIVTVTHLLGADTIITYPSYQLGLRSDGTVLWREVGE